MNKKLLSLLALTSSIALANGFHGNYETENVAELGAYIAPNKGNDTKGLEDNSPSLTTKHHARLLFHDADLLVFGGGSFTAKKDEPIANKAFYGVHHYVGGRVDTKVGKGFSVALTGAYKSNKDEENWFKNAIKKQTDIKGTEPKMEYGYESEKGYTTLFSAVTYGEFEGAKLNFGTIHRTEDFGKHYNLVSFAKVSKNFGVGSVDSELKHTLLGETNDKKEYYSNLPYFGKLNGEIKVKTDKLLDKTVFENVGKFEMKTIKATNDKGDREFSYGLDNKVTYTGIDKTTLGAFVNYNAEVKFVNLKQDDNNSTFKNKLHVGYEAKYDSNLELYTKTQNLTVFNNKIDDNFSNEGRTNRFDTVNAAKYKFSMGEVRAMAEFTNDSTISKEAATADVNKYFFIGGLGESAKTETVKHSFDVTVGFESQDTTKPANYLLTAWTKNSAEKKVNDNVKVMAELNVHAASHTSPYLAEPDNQNEKPDASAVLTEVKAGLEYKSGKHELTQNLTGRHLAVLYAKYKAENSKNVYDKVEVEHGAQVKSETKYMYGIAENVKFNTGLTAEYRYNQVKTQVVQLSDKLHEAFTKFVENTGVSKRNDFEKKAFDYELEDFAKKEDIDFKSAHIEDKYLGENTEKLVLKDKVYVGHKHHALELKYNAGFELGYLENKLMVKPSVEASAKFAGVDKTNFANPIFNAKAKLNLSYTW